MFGKNMCFFLSACFPRHVSAWVLSLPGSSLYLPSTESGPSWRSSIPWSSLSHYLLAWIIIVLWYSIFATRLWTLKGQGLWIFTSTPLRTSQGLTQVPIRKDFMKSSLARLTISIRLSHCLSSHLPFPRWATAPCESCLAVSSGSKATAQGSVKDAPTWPEQMTYMQIACVMYTQAPPVKLDHAVRWLPCLMFRITSWEEVSWFAGGLVCLSRASLWGGPEVGQPERSSFHPNRLSNYWWLQMPRGFDQDFCTRPCITTNTSTSLLLIIMWAQQRLLWIFFFFLNHLAGNGLHKKRWLI